MDSFLLIKGFFAGFGNALPFILPFFLIIYIIKSPRFKGKIGELAVAGVSRIALDKDIYKSFNDVVLPAKNGTTQIDHIIVSVYGIFVIETKNMKGWIFGSKNQKFWTQKLYKKSFRFQNPLHQNYKHVKALQEVFGLNDNQVHSVVVFAGDCELKTRFPENVVLGSGYIKYIKSKKIPVLSKKAVSDIAERLSYYKLQTSSDIKKRHIKSLKRSNKDRR